MNQCTKLFVFVCCIVSGVFVAFALADEGHAVDVETVQEESAKGVVHENDTIGERQYELLIDIANTQDKTNKYFEKANEKIELTNQFLLYLLDGDENGRKHMELLKNHTELNFRYEKVVQECRLSHGEYKDLEQKYDKVVNENDRLRTALRIVKDNNKMLSRELEKRGIHIKL